MHGMLGEGPPEVVQVRRLVLSTSQAESAEVEQSPHLFITAVPSLSSRVEHHGVGELVYVHLWYFWPLYMKGNIHLSPSVVRQRLGILLPMIPCE